MTSIPAWARRGRTKQVLRWSREHVAPMSDAAFVRSAFRALLGRDPDDDGLAHYVRDLHRGRSTREEVLRHIGRSSEAVQFVLRGPGLRQHVASFGAARRAVHPSLRPLFFVHIMKCGGTSFAEGLSALAGGWPRLVSVRGGLEQLRCLPPPLLADAMLVTGHLPYLARELLAPDVALCTVLREPRSRTLSHFAHVRQHEGEPTLSLDEFVHEPTWRARWADHQVNQLGLDGEPGTVEPGEVLALARQRLDSMELVGIADDLDELLARVASFWGKPAPPLLSRSNETARRVDRDEISDELLAAIDQGTKLDAALYVRAQELRAAAH